MKEKYTKFKNKTFDDPRVFDVIRGILLGGYRHMFSRVKKYSEYEDGDSVLEIGCGTGIFSKLFPKGYFGVDYAPEFIEYAKVKYPHQRFMLKSAQAVDFPRHSFDKILLLNFIHFLSDKDSKELLEKCSKIAKKSVIIIEPLKDENLLTKFFYSQNRGHNIKTQEELRKVVGEEFDIERMEEFNSAFYKLLIIKAVPKVT